MLGAETTEHAGGEDGSVVSDRRLVARVQRLRVLGGLLELVLWVVVAGSALAFGAVHPWAYRALWLGCGLAALLAAAWAAGFVDARRHLGARTVGLHSTGRWLVEDPSAGDPAVTWRCDLGAPVLPRGPLLWPGVVFLGLVALQLVPWPPLNTAITVSRDATQRGLGFLVSLLALHLSASIVLAQPGARRRVRRLVSWLGLGLGLVALGQLAAGASLIYGFFQPWEASVFYGPFVNRNHFAGYMLLVIPVGLGLLGEAWGRFRRHLGEHPGVRRTLVGLGTRTGTGLLYAGLPSLVAIAALLASTSRGGLLAFGACLALAGASLRRGRGTPIWGAGLAFALVALSWFGLERLEVRFARATDDAPGRTVVWGESIALMNGSRWITGYGFNTFGETVSRVPAWRLPEAATPWPESIREALESESSYGYRVPNEVPGLAWYREAHNDWLQLLVESGGPGLAIGLWAALAALLPARREPWLFAALAGPLVHAFVEFDFQIPAIPVLFVVLAALAGASGSGKGRHH